MFNTLSIQGIILDKNNNSNNNSITIDSFTRYMKFPYFISTKIFYTFTNKTSYHLLSKNDFVNGMITLYFATLEQRQQFIFNMFDISSQGKINPHDIRLCLLHLHKVTNNSGTSNSNNNNKSDSTLEKVIAQAFPNMNTSLNEDEFNLEITYNSDVLVLLLLYINYLKPFSLENITYINKLIEQPNGSFNSHYNLISKNNINFDNYADSTQMLFTYLNEHFNMDIKHQEVLVTEIDEEELNFLSSFENDITNVLYTKLPRKTTSDNELQHKPQTIIYGYENNKSHTINDKSSDMLGKIDEKFKRRNYKKEIANTTAINKKDDFINNFRIKHGYVAPPQVNLLKVEALYTMNYITKGNIDNYNTPSLPSSNNNSLNKCILHLLNNELILMNFAFYDQSSSPLFSNIIVLSNMFLSFHSDIRYNKKTYYVIKLTTLNINITNSHTIMYDFYISKADVAHDLKNKLKQYTKHKLYNTDYELGIELLPEQNGKLFKSYSRSHMSTMLTKIILKKNISNQNTIDNILNELNTFKFLSSSSKDDDDFICKIEIIEELTKCYILYEYPSDGQMFYYISKAGYTQLNVILVFILQIVKQVCYLHEYGFVYGNEISRNAFVFKHEDSPIIMKLINYENCKVLLKDEYVNVNSNNDDDSGERINEEDAQDERICAPELKEMGKFNQSADIWEIGIMAYRLLYNKIPVFNEQNGEVEFPSECQYCIGLFEKNKLKEINNVICKCLDKDMHKRPSAKDVKNEMESILKKQNML